MMGKHDLKNQARGKQFRPIPARYSILRPLSEIAEGYRPMDERRAIKGLLDVKEGIFA